MTCAELLIRLLRDTYGVDTVFGIPGVHTVELYRGLEPDADPAASSDLVFDNVTRHHTARFFSVKANHLNCANDSLVIKLWRLNSS